MRYAEIFEEVVVNTVEAEEAYAIEKGLIPSDTARIGQGYKNGIFFDPPPPPALAPEIVSRAQGKAALIKANLWDAVIAYVASITDPTSRALSDVALNDTQEWSRNSVFLNTAAKELGLPQEQLDALFIAASKEQF